MIVGSVTPITELADANDLGDIMMMIRMVKKSEGEINEGRRELSNQPKSKSQNPQNEKYTGLYWSKRSKQYHPLPVYKNERNQKRSIYWSKRSDDLDFKDFLPFSTIIRH